MDERSERKDASMPMERTSSFMERPSVVIRRSLAGPSVNTSERLERLSIANEESVHLDFFSNEDGASTTPATMDSLASTVSPYSYNSLSSGPRYSIEPLTGGRQDISSLPGDIAEKGISNLPEGAPLVLCSTQLLRRKNVGEDIKSMKFLGYFASGMNCIIDLHVTASSVPGIVDSLLNSLLRTGVIAPDQVIFAKRSLYRSSLDDENAESMGKVEVELCEWCECIQGPGFVVALGRVEGLAGRMVCFGRLAHAINLGGQFLDRFVILCLGPRVEENPMKSVVEVGRTFATLLFDDLFWSEATESSTENEVKLAVRAYLKRQLSGFSSGQSKRGQGDSGSPSNHSKLADDPLRMTGRFAGGLVRDLKRRSRWYWNDWKLPRPSEITKYLSTIVLLYFLALIPSVSFGNYYAELTMDEETHIEYIGVTETLLSQAISGMAFAIFGGQPMLFLQTSGPLAVFAGIIFKWATVLHVPALPFFAWTGVWTGIFCIIIAVSDLSALARYYNKFAEEVFSFLISMIFIYEAARYLVQSFINNPAADFLLELVLAVMTCGFGLKMVQFRRSPFVTLTFRVLLADFGAPLAVILATGFAAIIQKKDGLSAPKINIPTEDVVFPTSAHRPWLVPMLDLPMPYRFMAAGPGLLLIVLFFLDHNITGLIINQPQFKLKKGPAYHLDMLVAGLLFIVSSILGIPWCNAALPHSPMHVRALADVQEVEGTGGRMESRILRSRESRWTMFLSCALVLLTFLVKDYVLKILPMAVLYGFFFYMGILSVEGNAFFDRMVLLVTQKSKYPPSHYVRRVPALVIHSFTLIQALAFLVLWFVQANLYMPGGIIRADLFYPIVILAIILLRAKILPLIFSARHLDVLSSHEIEDDRGDL